MKKSYFDFITETVDFPQDEFNIQKDRLTFHDVSLQQLIEEHGSPLRITYLPAIREQIKKAQKWFGDAIDKLEYTGNYHYSYCTKSNHFAFVLEEVLRNDTHLELSSAYDTTIVGQLLGKKQINKDRFIICNGYKTQEYKEGILNLRNKGLKNVIPILDNTDELTHYTSSSRKLKIGIRVAAQEQPSYEFYTARLGIRYDKITDFYIDKILNVNKIELYMLHFFIDSGIKDAGYFWIELEKAITLYCRLRKICPTLNALNIGGGLPFKNSLAFEYDYAYIIEEVVQRIKSICAEFDVPEPDLYTEFGKFTVGSSGIQIFSVLGEKQQNDIERWYMLNGSLITSLPDIWGMSQRYIMLPINLWENEPQRVNIGGISCDIDDYYNAEAHVNQVFLPKINGGEQLHIAFFNIGAYQEALSGYGGIKHCLIPGCKHIIIDEKHQVSVFRDTQKSQEMLKILGY